MPPNKKGGKGYKKGKHGGDQDVKMFEWDENEGQMLGRVLKSLGNRRFRVFCNDNKERLCKLCGSTRKSEWVDEGAIVLLGIRQLSTSTSSTSEEVADILTLVDTRLYGKLKKTEGVNILLFSHVEREDSAELRRKIKAQEEGKAIDDDDIFDRGEEDSEEEEEQEEGDGLTGEERKKAKQQGRDEKKRKQDTKLAEARTRKEDRDDIDIDAI